MNDRKKYILVRHRSLNGKEVMLQRQYRLPWTFWLVWVWRDWKLLNQDLYEIDEKIDKKLVEIEELLHKRRVQEDFLKAQIKDIEASTHQTRGFSTPFKMKVKVKDIPFRNQRWSQPVDDSWKKALSPNLLKRTGAKGGGKSGRDGTRGKVGAPDRLGGGDTTVYLDKDLASLRYSLNEMEGVDNTMLYQEPQKQKKKKKKNKNGQHNNYNEDDIGDWDKLDD